MSIVVKDDRLKIYHAKHGYNKIFGKDVPERQKMADQQLLSLFDTVWKNLLGSAVAKAEKCDFEDAKRKLKPDQQFFLKENQEHREFWLDGGLFIAQLADTNNNDQELTQLWFIKSSNVDPRTLFVTFDTLEKREEFEKLATRLGYTDSELGKKLLMDFLQTVLNKDF